jgi:catechol 2,3-dioxygenase-like lactoylglutathione lyase family enzyme
MNILRLDSVVFETPDLARLRKFYLDVLGLRIGTYEKTGKTVADEDSNYFNLNIGGTLLGFESGQAQAGTIVLAVEDLPATLADLKKLHIAPGKAAPNFAIITDPDGREIILQEIGHGQAP